MRQITLERTDSSEVSFSNYLINLKEFNYG